MAACGGAANPQPVTPAGAAPVSSEAAPAAAAPASAAPPADPFAVPAGPRDEAAAEPAVATSHDLSAWKKAVSATGLAAPPPVCASYVKRAPSKGGSDLAAAFSEKDPAKLDARLVAASADPKASHALVLALRADLAPVECADAIVDPYLRGLGASASAGDAANVRLLVGLSLAGKLARTATTIVSMGSIRDKEKVKAFVNGPLQKWLREQSTAIELLSSGAAGLDGYARGVAAIQAGIAELRLVDKMRGAPVPASWDPELKSIYEAALDEALEPRKKRGRDAALIGMSDFARAGILRDARLDRARALLSKLYGGRRIDALDGLLLPAPAQILSTHTPSAEALANVSAYWVENGHIWAADDPAFLSRGVTRSLRESVKKKLEGSAGDETLREAYAQARLELGFMYWRRVDFVEAAYAAKDGKAPVDRLILAVSLALAHGPNGAAEMMRAETPAALDLHHTEALDAFVAEGGPGAGLAAYDAAHLRSLAAPEGDAAVAYLRDVAARFRNAEALLTDPAQKKLAGQRARETDAILVARAPAKVP